MLSVEMVQRRRSGGETVEMEARRCLHELEGGMEVGPWEL